MTRFRHIPTFGTGTIRRFSDNVSEMKKLAARDFEDILQVSGHAAMVLKNMIDFVTGYNSCN